MADWLLLTQGILGRKYTACYICLSPALLTDTKYTKAISVMRDSTFFFYEGEISCAGHRERFFCRRLQLHSICVCLLLFLGNVYALEQGSVPTLTTVDVVAAWLALPSIAKEGNYNGLGVVVFHSASNSITLPAVTYYKWNNFERKHCGVT